MRCGKPCKRNQRSKNLASKNGSHIQEFIFYKYKSNLESSSRIEIRIKCDENIMNHF